LHVSSLNDLRLQLLAAAIDAHRSAAPDPLQDALRDQLEALAAAARSDATPILVVHHARTALEAWDRWKSSRQRHAAGSSR
jgi:hypothetical protein